MLDEIAAEGFDDVDFLLVNNGSTDGSEDLIRDAGHPFIDLPRNRGVGHSYIEALDWALPKDYAFFGAMAGNGKMLASEVPRLLEPPSRRARRLRDGKPVHERRRVTELAFVSAQHDPDRQPDRLGDHRATRHGCDQRVSRVSSRADAACDVRLARRVALHVRVRVLPLRQSAPREERALHRGGHDDALPAEGTALLEDPTRPRLEIAMLQPWVRARVTPGGFS